MSHDKKPLPLVAAVPFDADYPYRLSEQGYDKLYTAKHLLGLIGDLATVENAAYPYVTVSREALQVLTAHLRELLETI